jgi:rRNA processing protein Krr1/Pno1
VTSIKLTDTNFQTRFIERASANIVGSHGTTNRYVETLTRCAMFLYTEVVSLRKSDSLRVCLCVFVCVAWS